MGKNDSDINRLASALKGQPRLNLTDSAATDARDSVTSLANSYSHNDLSVGTGTPPTDPPIKSGVQVAKDLKVDGEMAVDKFKAMVTVLEATDSSIAGVTQTLKNISNTLPG
ncbi:MAG: hypothetical protein U0R77_07450 [Mycolicibacterium insubricum]|uniref:hypothetical protein n=1 Tax=Mycolicibacterium insubricum TaxID=444597 RepID=UPI001056A983|nr:hypothetical protein [Mycolicibacterium insubricum]MCB0930216.1 hypothetical protein [Mycobacterium sp.]MCV7081227.1 hypothetical protein [Mycolicibacterium insubricum]BBZ67186.1 hypothetical protein MINS_26150 [Mycolicibacterium insubricum]